MKLTLGPCEINAVIGPPCSGKTFLIGEWLKSQNRYVRFDVTGETTDDPSVEHFWQDNRGSGPLRMYDRITAKPWFFKIAYHPGNDIEDEFRKTLSALWRRKEIFKTICCDEFHHVCSLNNAPDFVLTMLRYARHGHTSVIGASQRLADVHRLFTAGCRKTIIFRSEESRDYVAVQERWGEQCADAMIALRPLIYDDQTQITHQIPQCLVIPRGGRPSVYDFSTDEFIRLSDIESRRSQEDIALAEELQREDCRSEPESGPDDLQAGSGEVDG